MVRRQLPLFPNQPETPEDISKHTPIGATFDLFAAYLQKDGKSEHTVKAFIGDLHLLADFSGHQTTIGQFTTTNLNEFMHWIEFGRGVPCSRKSYARRVTTLKVYFKWLKQIDALVHDPAKAVLQRSGPAPLSNVLTREDIKQAILSAREMKKGDQPDTRPEFLFQLLLETGIKKSEAGRLELEDFDVTNPENASVRIKHKAKNVYKERRIAVSKGLIDLLAEYRLQYNLKKPVFTCTTRNLEYILTDIGEGAGIAFKLSFEVMRWTTAVHDALNDVDDELIREKLGLSKTSWYETSNKINQLLERLANESAKS